MTCLNSPPCVFAAPASSYKFAVLPKLRLRANEHCTGNTLHGKLQKKEKKRKEGGGGVAGEKARRGEALFVAPKTVVIQDEA